jgi:hypothetical protein
VKGLGLSRHISLWCDFAQVQCTTAHFASPPSRPPYQLPSSAHGFDGVAAASPPPTVVPGHGPRTSSMSYLILTLTISNSNFGHHHIDDNQHMATPVLPCRPAPPCHHTPPLGLSAAAAVLSSSLSPSPNQVGIICRAPSTCRPGFTYRRACHYSRGSTPLQITTGSKSDAWCHTLDFQFPWYI